ncbi:MAG: GNAT family N-acetyltransferase [Hyphomonadaceae bacterium]
MLEVSRERLLTPRLELRRTRIEDAAAMFEALRHSEMYTYTPRNAPESVEDVATRFARVMQEMAPDRTEQWLNWTVWLSETGAPLGTIEATVSEGHSVSIGYLFDPRVWRRGYAREAVSAMIEHLRECGAAHFEAVIDIRNLASKRLVGALDFQHVRTSGLDETWRL